MHSHLMRTHGNLKTLKCLNCKQKFASATYLRNHLLQYKEVVNVSDVDTSEHPILGNKKPAYACNICDVEYITESSIRRHLYQFHADVVSMKCLHCKRRFIKKKTFTSHMFSHHIYDEVSAAEGNINRQTCSNIKDQPIEPKSEKEATHLCKICNAKYIFSTSISNHLYQVHGDRKSMSCLHCNKQFVELQAFRAHMYKHRGTNKPPGLQVESEPDGKSVVCSLCHKSCANRYSFTRHMYNCHAEMENRSCLNCDQQFESLEELHSHLLMYAKNLLIKSSNEEIEIIDNTGK